jgi:hypothetical protein
MFRPAVLGLVTAASITAMIAACTGGGTPPASLPMPARTQDAELGYTVVTASQSGPVNRDGTQTIQGSTDVTVGDRGTRTIEFERVDLPVSSDAHDVLTLEDKTTNQRITFEADQEFQRFTIRSGNTVLTLTQNPNDSWLVADKRVKTNEEAATQILAHPIKDGLNRHVLATLDATLAVMATEGTRGAVRLQMTDVRHVVRSVYREIP